MEWINTFYRTSQEKSDDGKGGIVNGGGRHSE